jgi:Protein of unknown function, DUF547
MTAREGRLAPAMGRRTARGRSGSSALFAAVLAIGLAGCTAIRPVKIVPPPAAAPGGARTFSHHQLDRVLAEHVDDRGRVDYTALERNPVELETYYDKLSLYSPDNHPELFPTDQDKLAYWIDAYNGSMLTTVVRYYPIASVEDVPTPFPLSLVSDKIGIFFLRRIALGGATTSFYGLENSVVRTRFEDPRVHFALNCASGGCPRLPRRAFTGPELEQQLDVEARRFFSERRNLEVDHQARVVRLSSILKWYSSDFTDWMKRHHPERAATLVEYARLYAPPERAADLERARGYEVEFIEYDWKLNDQARTD